MILYLELPNCKLLGTSNGEFIRFSRYNWMQILDEETKKCSGNLCLVLEKMYKEM